MIEWRIFSRKGRRLERISNACLNVFADIVRFEMRILNGIWPRHGGAEVV